MSKNGTKVTPAKSAAQDDDPVSSDSGDVTPKKSSSGGQTATNTCCRIPTLFNPENKYRLRWDVIIMIFIVFNAIMVPIQLGLDPELPAIFVWLDNIADSFFIIDVMVQFRTGFRVRYGADTVLVMDTKQIAMRYLSGWFGLDVLSIGIPFGLVDNVELDPLLTEVLKATAVLKIFRLLRLGRLAARLIHVSIEYQHIARIFKLIISFFFFCHFFGCLFYYVGRINTCNTSVAAGYASALAAYNGTGTAPEAPDACEWLTAAGIRSADLGSQYVTALYWAMMTATTVGYGDISITNNGEMVYAVLVMIMSNLMGAIIFGNVTTLIQSLNAAENRHSNRTEMIEELIENHNITNELAERMRDTIEYQWDLTRCFDMDQVLELLPRSLRMDVLMYVHKQLIMKVPFFRDCDDAFIKSVVYRLQSELILKGDVLFHEGDAADEMYFLRRGRVNILAPRSTKTVVTLSEGGYFGEIGILVEHGRRSNTVVAASKCEYYVLAKADLDWVMDRFPEYRELLRGAALQRLHKMSKMLQLNMEEDDGKHDLIEGRILIEVGKMRGATLTHHASEKFVKVTVKGHEQMTKQLDPQHARDHDFNSIFNFHFQDERECFHGTKIDLDVMQHNRMRAATSCGNFSITVADLPHGQRTQEWFPVKRNGAVIGEIHLAFLFHQEGLTKSDRQAEMTRSIRTLSQGNLDDGETKSSATNIAATNIGATNIAAVAGSADRIARLESQVSSLVDILSTISAKVDTLAATR